jgi:hypothetical protein
MRLMGAGVISAGVVNHLSFYTMDEVGLLGEGQRLTIFAAEKDDILPTEKRRETEDVLKRQERRGQALYSVGRSTDSVFEGI